MSDFITRIQSQIAKYSDINAVFHRFLDSPLFPKFKILLHDFFQTESSHILEVLQKTQKDLTKYQQAYELNINILKTNLSLVSQLIIEEIGSEFVKDTKHIFPLKLDSSQLNTPTLKNSPTIIKFHSKQISQMIAKSDLKTITETNDVTSESSLQSTYRCQTESAIPTRIKNQTSVLNKKTLQFLLQK